MAVEELYKVQAVVSYISELDIEQRKGGQKLAPSGWGAATVDEPSVWRHRLLPAANVSP